MQSFSLTRQSNCQFVLTCIFSGTARAWCLSYLRTEEDITFVAINSVNCNTDKCNNNHKCHKTGAPNGNFRENICSEDDLRTRIFVACVASVSSRGSSRKLGQEQKKINDGGGGGDLFFASALTFA